MTSSSVKHLFLLSALTSLLFILAGCARIKDLKYSREGNALNMSRKGLTKFPEEAFENKELRVLRLYGNSIDSIPDRISELTKLEKLFIGRNDIKYVPASIGELKNLKVFSAQYNEIDSLPDEICDLPNLEQLWLNQNKLTSLPDSLGKLKNLEILQVKFNFLDSLPSSIGDCENLRFVHLQRNNLLELPKSMAKLSSLKELYLSGAGPLLWVPEEMCDLRFFELIQIDANTVLPPCMYVLQANRLQIIQE
jgi:Leucine-rich repeat (LRR) protein